MKKHKHFKSIERKERKNNTGKYFSLFLIVVMIGGLGSVFFYAPHSGSTGQEYSFGTHNFKVVDNQWVTEIENEDISFYFLPDQLLHFDVDERAMDRITDSSGIVVAFNPVQNETVRLQVLDLFRFELFEAFTLTQKQTGFAVTNATNLYQFPLVTCQNATFFSPVVDVDYANETSITLVDDCVVVRASDHNTMVSLLDRLRYEIFGVYE